MHAMLPYHHRQRNEILMDEVTLCDAAPMYELPYNLNEPDDLPTLIRKSVGIAPSRISELHGSMIGQVYRLDFPDGTALVAKHNPAPDARLDIEAEMLRQLRTPDVIRVPDVLFESRHLLIQEMIPGVHLEPPAKADACKQLAALHEVTSPQAGLGGTTLNGSLEIPSPWTDSWIEFFRDHRLRFTADAARDKGDLLPEYWERAHLLAGRLDDLLIEPEACSLMHGEVWPANVLSLGDRVTGFIDPSTCYGDPELELAYMSLFGEFSNETLQSYAAIRPLAPGFWSTRRYVYAVYPALMHVLYFGDRFVPLLNEMLTKSGV